MREYRVTTTIVHNVRAESAQDARDIVDLAMPGIIRRDFDTARFESIEYETDDDAPNAPALPDWIDSVRDACARAIDRTGDRRLHFSYSTHDNRCRLFLGSQLLTGWVTHTEVIAALNAYQ